jgi:Bacterial Ig domain/RTX calcium-binding nonapeptide repeat (4 copies)/Calcineurin-like phosphoesterase
MAGGLSLGQSPLGAGGAVAAEAAVLLAAGDVAGCTSPGDEATSAILDGQAGVVATLGDNAYPDGTPDQFAQCYEPSWGRHKWRTRPSVGNHEYRTPGAAGYFGYFGSAAGEPGKGYYSYDLGAWHVVVLNSQCWEAGGCEAGAPQEEWLRADLAASGASCTLAYWHHARFSSGRIAQLEWTEPLWKALWENGADVVLAGHDHIYERHARLAPSGDASPAHGIRQFVVGTGGHSHSGIVAPLATSEVRNSDTFGILKLTLREGGYDWLFLPEAGMTFTDAGSESCHGAPPDVTSPTVSLLAPDDGALVRGGSTAAAEASDDVALRRVEFIVDATPVGRDTTPPYAVSWDSTRVPDGVRTLRARAIDAAGNPTNSVGRRVLIDNTLPETAIVSRPRPVASSATAVFSFTSEPGATFECALDRRVFTLCASPVRYDRLAQGRHTFLVRARDAAGNLQPTPSAWAWTVDTTRPATTLLSGRVDRGAPARASFAFESNERGAAFQCSLDGGPWFGCASPAVFEGLAAGPRSFRVRAIDPAGNVDWSPAAREWRPATNRGGVIAWGSEDADVILGTSGPDLLYGFGGDDLLRGGGANDVLDAGEGDDRLKGGAANDRLAGGRGIDALVGGAGRDFFEARDGMRDRIHGGRGRDTARADRRLDVLRAVERRR